MNNAAIGEKKSPGVSASIGGENSLKCQPSPPPNPQGARERVSLSRAPCGLGGGDG